MDEIITLNLTARRSIDVPSDGLERDSASKRAIQTQILLL